MDWASDLDADKFTRDTALTASFIRDPDIFGTAVRKLDAAGAVSGNGKAKVSVYNTNLNYSYIITDTSGNIVGYATGDISARNHFEGLYPAHTYRVYEAVGAVAASLGDNISAVPNISDYAEVHIPTLAHNYKIEADETNTAKTKIIISLADELSEYALLDEQDHIVLRGDEWLGVVDTSNPKVIFDNLESDKSYKVVARPKSDTAYTAMGQYQYHSVVSTEFEFDTVADKFILETQGGEISSIGDNPVNALSVDDVSKSATVNISAAPTNFKYWRVVAGYIDGVSGNVRTNNYSFTMPEGNVVLKAYYDNPANPETSLGDELRGEDRLQASLDAQYLDELRDSLRHQDDIDLYNATTADIDYKLVYKRGSISAAERSLIANQAEFLGYADSYVPAWALDVVLERYVDGRRVDRSLSDAELSQDFKTYIQLQAKDLDMLDYRIYKISYDTASNPVITDMSAAMSSSPEDTAGLFSINTFINKRYVLAYNKTYQLKFNYRFENM